MFSRLSAQYSTSISLINLPLVICALLGNYSTYLLLRILKLLQTSNGSSDSRGRRCSELPATTSDGSLATTASPDSCSLSSDGILTAERASVGGVGGDLESLGYLSQGGAISSAVLTSDTNLLGALGHLSTTELGLWFKKLRIL
jgi:hypothetical protein